MYDDPKSKISQLQKVLDAREDLVSGKVTRHNLPDKEYTVNQDWADNEPTVGTEISNPAMEQKLNITTEAEKVSRSWKILIGSAVFFALAILVVIYRFFFGGNMVSGNNIEVTVKAPIAVAGGEVLPFEINIKNNNSVTLLGADLGVTFPLGSRETLNPSLPAKRVQTFIGDILPGQTIKKNLSVVLFGTENEKKDISLNLEYKTAGSNSLFNKTKSFTVLISSAPVSVVVLGPKEVNTNQTVDFTIEVTSNSESVIKNLLLKADYPFGFSFLSSDPKTYSKNNAWLLGDLAAGEKRTIHLSGVLNGQEGEERGFTFNLGSPSGSDSLSIDTPFTSSFSSITIRRPFVSANILLNGENTTEYVSSAGSKVETLINWRNNLPNEVTDVSIVVKLSGNSLDKSSVQAEEGLYRSIDNTIIFNKTTDPELARLEPGQEGSSKFSFGSFKVGTVTGLSLINPTIVLDVIVSGEQVNYRGSSDNILFSDSRKVKLTSSPQLFAKALYFVGPFQNHGPVPAKAEQETTYTITWTITNPLNNLSQAQVSAILPPYIKWQGVISPDREKVNYNPDTGQVVWAVGNISAGAGILSSAREVSFQISFLPSVNQIGTTPILVNEAVLIARDSFTLTTVTDNFSFLTTRLGSDPYFRAETEMVTQ